MASHLDSTAANTYLSTAVNKARAWGTPIMPCTTNRLWTEPGGDE